MNSDSLDVVGVGLATLDVLIRCEATGEGRYGIALREFMLEGGGPVATALCAAQKLGASTGYVGTAGTDFAGDCKLRSLTRYGVDVGRAVRRRGPEHDVILVQVDLETGERSFSGLGGERPEPLRPEELDRDYIAGARCLHLDGCQRTAALAAARWMREAGKPVVLDAATTSGPVRAERRELVRSVDVLISGKGFCEALTGLDRVQEACRAARELGPEVVVQTEGEDGCHTSCDSGEFHTPAFEVDVVDTTGAGDVFHGAYLVGLLEGWSPERNALFASAVAAMKCRQMGGRQGVGTMEETVRFLRKRGVSWG